MWLGHGHRFRHEFGHGLGYGLGQAQNFIFGHGFGHGHEMFLTSDADSDTDSDKVMTSDTDMGSDKGMSENLGHGQTSDTRVRSSLLEMWTTIIWNNNMKYFRQFLSTQIQYRTSSCFYLDLKLSRKIFTGERPGMRNSLIYSRIILNDRLDKSVDIFVIDFSIDWCNIRVATRCTKWNYSGKIPFFMNKALKRATGISITGTLMMWCRLS